MDNLRDLVVGISLNDKASRKVERLDDKIDDVSTGFNQMGRTAEDSLGDIELATKKMANTYRDANGRLRYANGKFVKDAKRSKNAVDEIGDEVDDARRSINRFGFSGMVAFSGLNHQATKFVGLTGLIVAGLSAIVAISAPLVVGIMGLATSLAAAGAGAVAFGAVAVSALAPIFDETAELNKEQQKVRDNLNNFKSFWVDFTKQFQSPIYQAFSLGLESLEKIFVRLEPTISNVSAVVVELFEEFNKGLGSSGATKFFDWLATNAAESLYNWSKIMGNTLGGVFGMFQAFTPVGASMEESLVKITQRFNDWGNSLSNSESFQKFVEYAKENTPTLMGFLGNLGSILKDIVVGLAPLGSLVLKGLQIVTGFLANNVTPIFAETGGRIGEFASKFKDILLPIIQQVMPIINERIELFKQIGISLMNTFQEIFPTIQNILQTVLPIGINLFQKVSGVVGSLITKVVLPLLPMLGKVLEEVWGVVKPILGPLNRLFSAVADQVMFLINEVVSPLIPIMGEIIGEMWEDTKPYLDAVVSLFTSIADVISGALEKYNNFVKAVKNFKMPKIGMPKWMGGNGFIQTDGSHATGLARVPRDGYIGELHKDESVLTAKQSNALRDAGILRSNANGTPVLDMGSNNQGVTVPGSSGAPSLTINNLIIQGAGDTPSDIKHAIKEAWDEYWQSFGRINEQVTLR